MSEGLNITTTSDSYEDLSGVDGDGLGEEEAFEGEEQCWEVRVSPIGDGSDLFPGRARAQTRASHRKAVIYAAEVGRVQPVQASGE